MFLTSTNSGAIMKKQAYYTDFVCYCVLCINLFCDINAVCLSPCVLTSQLSLSLFPPNLSLWTCFNSFDLNISLLFMPTFTFLHLLIPFPWRPPHPPIIFILHPIWFLSWFPSTIIWPPPGPLNSDLRGLGNKSVTYPPLNDGEALCSRIIEMGPPNEKFLRYVWMRVKLVLSCDALSLHVTANDGRHVSDH